MIDNQKTLRVLKTLRVWIFKIRGSSLAPAYRDGDYVVCLPATRLRPGTVVVFDHPDYGRLIKRVEGIEADGRLVVLGDDTDSVDSRRFGPIAPGSISGRVVWHIRK